MIVELIDKTKGASKQANKQTKESCMKIHKTTSKLETRYINAN